MKSGNEATAITVDAFRALDIDFFLAGSYSSNFYGIPRATRDADFVVILSQPIETIAAELGEEFILDPQSSFEGITGTRRDIFNLPAIAFKIEIFQLSEDPHDQSRFARRLPVFDELVNREIFIPTAEDVIITKLRWEKIGKRGKDATDVRDVITVQGDAALNWKYIHHWANEHGTRKLLNEIRASIPPID